MRLLLLLAVVSMMIPSATNTKATTPTPTAAQSEELKQLNSDRNKATLYRKELEDSQDSWHTAYLWLGGIGALLVIASWLSQKMESSKSYAQRPLTEKISSIDARIGAINDDVNRAAIAQAQSVGSQADAKAEEAREKNLALANELEVARGETKKLDIQAEQLRQANLDTETRLASANAEITQLNAQRIGLEQTLYPRILFVGTMFVLPKNDPRFERIKNLSGTKVAFRYVGDAECRRALHQIKEVLKAANWELSSETQDDTRNEWFWDGVNIEWPPIDVEKLPSADSPDRMRYLTTELAKSGNLRKAAEELAEYLREMGWNAKARPGFPPKEGGPPYDAIQVVVGFKPLTYFEPDEIKQMNEQMRQLQHKTLMEDRKEDERFPPH